MRPALFIAMRLARENILGSDASRILRLPTDVVLSAIEYIGYANTMAEADAELNKPEAQR